MTVLSVRHLSGQLFEPDIDRFVYSAENNVYYIPNNPLEQTKSCSFVKYTNLIGGVTKFTLGGMTQLGFNKIVYANGHIYLGGASQQASGSDVAKERPTFAKVGSVNWVY